MQELRRFARFAARVTVWIWWWLLEGSWTVAVLPDRERWRMRRRRERDTALVREVAEHMRGLLARRDDVSTVRWMSDEEARATEP